MLREDNNIPFKINNTVLSKLEALVSNINGVNFGQENYKGNKKKIVAYMYFIIKDHPFIDGNKRTAVLSFVVLTNLNGEKLKINKNELDELAVFIEKTEGDHHEIINMLADFLFE